MTAELHAMQVHYLDLLTAQEQALDDRMRRKISKEDYAARRDIGWRAVGAYRAAMTAAGVPPISEADLLDMWFEDGISRVRQRAIGDALDISYTSLWRDQITRHMAEREAAR